VLWIGMQANASVLQAAATDFLRNVWCSVKHASCTVRGFIARCTVFSLHVVSIQRMCDAV